tara:strand:- start:6928 stop:7308 length:381 start_codon:yes stop_codon:yes gene_type:complete
MNKEQLKYVENVVKYNVELYEKLMEKAQELSEEEESDKYVKFLLVSTSQECLFKIKEIYTHCKQLFNEVIDVPKEIETLLRDIKPAFYLEKDKLMNVSGMEINEMTDFIKNAVDKSNTKDAEEGNS